MSPIPPVPAAALSSGRRTRYPVVFGARLTFWPLLLLTLIALALRFGVWHSEYKFAGPFAAETNPPQASLKLELPEEGPAPWWLKPLLGDDAASPRQSFLELFVNGRQMGPPHTVHQTIRERKDAGFSHWGSWVIFSLPDGVANGPETVLTLRYVVRPWSWITLGLTAASAVFAWFLFGRTFVARHGAVLLKGPYLILSGFLWAGLAASAVFVGCSFYALATGWALPTTALIRWSEAARWVARHEPYLGYLFLTLAGLGAVITWLIASNARDRKAIEQAVDSNEELVRRVLLWCGFPIVACLLIFCVSVMWGGIVRPGDPNRFNLGGLIPFSDAANYLTAAYDQVKDGDWNAIAVRRPFAAAFRSVLLLFGNFSLPLMLILQACMVAGAICFATYAIAVWRGVWAGTAFFALTYIYGRFFVPTTLTEPAGMFWALLSIPFFIKAIRDRSVSAALLAFAMTCFALLTRMGSMFTLPALLLWVVWQFGQTAAAKLRIFAVASCILLGSFGLNSLVQKTYESVANPNTSSFSYILCGLSMGTIFDGCMKKLASEGKPFETDEYARSSQLYAIAWDNIRAHPEIFIKRLADGAKAFVTELPALLWTGYGPLEEPQWLLRYAVTAIILIGLVQAVRRMKGVELSFWALLWASIVVSSCFIYFDDGQRTLAASHPLMALFFATGMSVPTVVTAKLPLRFVSLRFGSGVLIAAAVLFICLPWTMHRFSSIQALVKATPTERENEAFVFGGRRMSGFLVVQNGLPLPSEVPSLHLSEFEAIVEQSGLEYYQDLINPVLPPLPFGFIFAPRLEKGSASLNQYIVPAEVVTRREVPAWHFDLKHWDYRAGGHGEYWFYVTKATPWP